MATYAYSPYGTTTTSTGTQATTNPFRYEAGFTDTMGFIHFGARYLNPQLGTWTQQDPATTTSSYVYAGDSPVNFSDVSEHTFLTTIGTFIGSNFGAILSGVTFALAAAAFITFPVATAPIAVGLLTTLSFSVGAGSVTCDIIKC